MEVVNNNIKSKIGKVCGEAGYLQRDINFHIENHKTNHLIFIPFLCYLVSAFFTDFLPSGMVQNQL
jgi:hypothetical protein